MSSADSFIRILKRLNPPLSTVDSFIQSLDDTSIPSHSSIDMFVREIERSERSRRRQNISQEMKEDKESKRKTLLERLARVERRKKGGARRPHGKRKPSRDAIHTPMPGTASRGPLYTQQAHYSITLDSELPARPEQRRFDTGEWRKTHTPRSKLVARGGPATSDETPKERPAQLARPNTPIREATRLLTLRNTVAYLLRKNPLIDPDGPEGATILHKACREHQLPAVRYLVDRGVDVNSRSRHGDTCLLLTLRTAKAAPDLIAAFEVMRFLVENGADVNAADSFGKTAFLMSAGLPRRFMDLLLRSGAVATPADRAGYTPLHEAVAGGHMDTTRYLLKLGFNVNACSRTNWTVLHAAVQNHPTSLSIFKLLVKKGADIAARESYGGQSVLFSAAAGHRSSLAIARYLIKRGADVNQPDNRGLTPLDAALQNFRNHPGDPGFREMVRLLARAGGTARSTS